MDRIEERMEEVLQEYFEAGYSAAIQWMYVNLKNGENINDLFRTATYDLVHKKISIEECVSLAAYVTNTMGADDE